MEKAGIDAAMVNHLAVTDRDLEEGPLVHVLGNSRLTLMVHALLSFFKGHLLDCSLISTWNGNQSHLTYFSVEITSYNSGRN